MGTKALISVIALFGLGALFSFVTAWLLIISPVTGLFIDRPEARKVHQKDTPRIGGICIVALFLMFTVTWHCSSFIIPPYFNSQFFIAVIFGTIGIAIIGIIDDIILFTINSYIKFVIEVLIAVLIISISEIKLDTIYLFGRTYSLGYLAWPITMLWLVGVTNALNIVDGVDGLAGTVALVAFITIGILAYLIGDYAILIFCTLLAGLTVGFLAHNLSPARIFLGDTGSLFLGMMIGLLCIYLISNESFHYPVVIAPLIVGFPLVDVVLAISRRFFKSIVEGNSFFTSVIKTMDADNDHIHHRLMFRGLRHSQTTILIAVYSVTTCAAAVVIGIIDQGMSTILFLVYLALITAWFTYKLGFFDRIKIIYLSRKNRNYKPQSHLTSRINIIVLNADEFFRHALESFKQDVFSLHFVESGDIVDDKINFSAILVNNSHINHQEKELNEAINLSTRFQSPIVLVADEFTVSSCERTKRSNIKILFVHKPIYVPKLFNDLYFFAVTSDSVRTFSGVLTNETSVSALAERINNESI
jgi:UDP-GlcNAc:undecaprenyl-phosphate/decaprenyl-phosphate GlcNAc-1-phosphate transferase